MEKEKLYHGKEHFPNGEKDFVHMGTNKRNRKDSKGGKKKDRIPKVIAPEKFLPRLKKTTIKIKKSIMKLLFQFSKMTKVTQMFT